jgi:hypothetical protein
VLVCDSTSPANASAGSCAARRRLDDRPQQALDDEAAIKVVHRAREGGAKILPVPGAAVRALVVHPGLERNLAAAVVHEAHGVGEGARVRRRLEQHDGVGLVLAHALNVKVRRCASGRR